MKLWIKIAAGAAPAAAVLLLVIIVLCCRRRRKVQQPPVSPQNPLPQFSDRAAKSKFGNIHAGINKFHLSYKSGSSARRSLRFHHLNHHHHTPAMPPPSPFNWDEHPRLITEAVETGWPRFAFSSSAPRSSSGPLWNFCPACDGGEGRGVAETDWEVPPGSSEFMQTVKLSPGTNRTADDPLFFSWVRTSLPLPGPALGGGSFPQEAYFEITILYLQPRKKLRAAASRRPKDRESDQAKLIRANSGTGNIFTSQGPRSTAEQGNSSGAAVAVGLISRGATMPAQAVPGNFPGSIGFHSDGSVYLDGRKLVFESERAVWACANRVIGCGFEPARKRVFFTVDANLTHVIRCTSEAYGSPLYPVLAADSDAMLLVNLGQAPFKYAPANAARTQNPCFIRHPSADAGGGQPAGSVDSRELFSVSRMEAEWLERDRRSQRRNNSNSSSNSKKSNGNLDDNYDAESDLFEISLQG